MLLDLIREKRREEARKEKVEKIATPDFVLWEEFQKQSRKQFGLLPNGVGWGVSPRAKGPYTTILGQIPNPVFTHPPLSLHKLLCNVMDRSQSFVLEKFSKITKKKNLVEAQPLGGMLQDAK